VLGFRVEGDDGGEDEIADLGDFLHSTPEAEALLDDVLDRALRRTPRLPPATVEFLQRNGMTKLTIVVIHSLYMKAKGHTSLEYTTALIGDKLIRRIRMVRYSPDETCAAFLYDGLSRFE
jgi:hypothetical protein